MTLSTGQLEAGMWSITDIYQTEFQQGLSQMLLNLAVSAIVKENIELFYNIFFTINFKWNSRKVFLLYIHTEIYLVRNHFWYKWVIYQQHSVNVISFLSARNC